MNYFVIKQKERKKLIIKQTKSYFASEFERGTCVEKFLRVQAVILTFGNMHIRCCPVVEFHKTFWKTETANAIFWMYLGGTAKKNFF